MIRPTRTLVALLAVSVLGAACSGGGDAGADTSTSTSTTTTTAAPVEPGSAAPPVVPPIEVIERFDGERITVVGHETGARGDAIAGVLAEFGDAAGLEIVYVAERRVVAELPGLLASEDPPDVAVIDSAREILRLAEDRELVPATPELTERVAREFGPDWREVTNHLGQLMGVPHAVEANDLLWFNRRMLADAGQAVPTTAAELEDVAAELRAAGLTPWCVGLEAGRSTGELFTDWVEGEVLRRQGVEFYDRWVEHRIPFDDPAVVSAADAVVATWVEPGNVVSPAGTLTTSFFGADARALADGRCAMARHGAAFAEFLPADVPVFGVGSPGDGGVGVTAVPGPGAGTVVVDADFVVALTDKPEVEALMEFMAGPVYAERRAVAGGFVSPRLDVRRGLQPTGWERTVSEIVGAAEVIRHDASALMPAEVGDVAFRTAIIDISTGSRSVGAALAAAEATWRDLDTPEGGGGEG